MSVIKTQKVSVYVIGSKINEVIDMLQKMQVMEMTKGTKSLPESAIKGTSSELERVEKAIAAVKSYRPKGGFFKKRKSAPKDDMKTHTKHMKAARECVAEILAVNEEISRNRKMEEEADSGIKKCKVFEGFDLGNFSCETDYVKTETFIGRDTDIREALEKVQDIPFYFEEISNIKKEVVIFCIYLKQDKQLIEEIFSKAGFLTPDFALAGLTPKEKIAKHKKIKAESQSEILRLEEELARLSKGMRNVELLYDNLMLKKDRYSAFLSAQNTEKVFVLSGYVPDTRIGEVEKALKAYGCAMETEEPEEGEVLPSYFENNAFVSPVEEVTASYSMPSPEDIDPNPVMAVFYYWFFGMMFSDAGYGLLLMIVCGVLGFSKILDRGKRGMLRMFFWCGVSTTLWGIAYGSFFGDLIGTVSNVFGKGDVAFLPILIDPVNQALELLIIAVAFGLVHILSALIIKFSVLWKRGDRSGAVYDIGSWILVLSGIAAIAVGVATKIAVVKFVGITAAIIGVITLVAMGGRDKKSFVMRIFSGVLSLYDITSFLGDILSYSRLMALGLATGVIASVVNVLASLGGNSVFGAVVFIVVSIIGHTLNFAINMLGAYVHTNRLQYVEFYQKFYEGGGRRFNPLSMKTKYFDFTEE